MEAGVAADPDGKLFMDVYHLDRGQFSLTLTCGLHCLVLLLALNLPWSPSCLVSRTWALL